MNLTEMFQRNNNEKISLVTNNNDYFMFYQEPPEKTVDDRSFALEKVSDLTKCASMGVIYHFKTVGEAEDGLKNNYAEYEEF